MEQPPQFGGEPGQPVPQVDPGDLKAAWKLFQDCGANGAVGTGVDLLRQICKPGADMAAIGYRAAMLNLLTRVAPERLEPWCKDGRLDDGVLRAAARVQLEWMGVGITRQGWPFDVEEFVRLCGEKPGSIND
jgi:hypothetical protein